MAPARGVRIARRGLTVEALRNGCRDIRPLRAAPAMVIRGDSLTVVEMRGVPWWGVVSSAATPVLLIGGWTVAAGLQPQPFDSIRQSVSTLAGTGAADPWVMTLAFVVVAACYITTAMALRPAALAGRLVLIAAGLAGVLVAASPDAAPGSFSLAHAFWSALGFAFLAAWPLASRKQGPMVPWGLRPPEAVAASAVITVLLAWFLAELVTHGGQIGLAERVLGCAQALWPLLVVLSCRRSRSQQRAWQTGPRSNAPN